MSEGSFVSTMITITGETPSLVRTPHAFVGKPEVTLAFGSTLFVCKNREAYESLRIAFARLVLAGQELWPLGDAFDDVEKQARINIARYGVESPTRRTRPSGPELGL